MVGAIGMLSKIGALALLVVSFFHVQNTELLFSSHARFKFSQEQWKSFMTDLELTPVQTLHSVCCTDNIF